MTLRIFLTGDNHIGLKYTGHVKSKILKEARLQAFERMVDEANRENCSLFVIAGDLFENTYGILKGDIKTLLSMLSAFHGTVVVLPGNHDYYDLDTALWKEFRKQMSGCDNILLLNEYRPYPLELGNQSVVLYPAHCTSIHSAPGENNLGWIKELDIPRDNTFRIGLAHGAVEGETIDNEGAYFQMSRAELQHLNMDAWLIGHTHVPFPKELQEKYTAVEQPIFNAGTHVQRDVHNNTEGLCFIIDIDSDKKVHARKFISGDLRFCRRTVTVEAGKMEAMLREALKDVPDRTVAEIELRGAVPREEYENRQAIADGVMSRFLEADVSDYGLSKLISKELIESEFPETSFSAGLLTALLQEPKEAQMAYELMKSLKESK